MSKTIPAMLLALAVTSGLSLTGCDGGEPDGKPAERLDLRLYEVPKGHRHRLADAIRDVLASGEQRVGHVTVAPNGQLLVSAPSDLQPAIAKVIEGVSGSEPTPPRTVVTEYWLIRGESADAASVGRHLEKVPEVAKAIQSGAGPMRLSLYERVSVAAAEDAKSRVRSELAHIEQFVEVIGDTVRLNTRIRPSASQSLIDTEVTLREGETLVLGQGSQARGDDAEPAPGALFYAVRVRVR